MIFIRVLFPAPFSPMSPWTIPGRMSKSTAVRAFTPLKDLEMFLQLMSGVTGTVSILSGGRHAVPPVPGESPGYCFTWGLSSNSAAFFADARSGGMFTLSFVVPPVRAAIIWFMPS